MLKQGYQKTMVALGMLMGGVAPAFAGDLTVDSFKNASLEKGAENLEKGAKSGANIFLTIIVYGAIVLGAVFLLWGAYMAASKDTREEGKLKDGLKLAFLGIIFLTVGFVLKKISGVA